MMRKFLLLVAILAIASPGGVASALDGDGNSGINAADAPVFPSDIPLVQVPGPRTRSAVYLPSHGLSLTHVPQARCNWCGPAVVRMIVLFYGSNVAQLTVAADSGTGTNPPPYCTCTASQSAAGECQGMSGMSTQLNKRTPVSWSTIFPSTSDQLLSTVIYNVRDRVKPAAINTFEPSNTISYNFHSVRSDGKTTFDIGHYVAGEGVNSGWTKILLKDPAAGSPDLGWSSAAPAISVPVDSLLQTMRYPGQVRGITQ